MSKFYGKIGFIQTIETSPGIWTPKLITAFYYGDVIRNNRRWGNNQNSINDNLEINNEFSIIADSFIYENLHLMKYIEYLGVKWTITNVEIQRPRLIITVGGVYTNDDEK